MANIILPGRSGRPPGWPMQLRSGHPLAENLVVFAPLVQPGVYRNLVDGVTATGTYPTQRTYAPRAPGRIGGDRVGSQFTGSEVLKWTVPPGISQQYGWTLAAGIYIGDAAYSGATGRICSLQLASATTESGFFLSASGAGVAAAGSVNNTGSTNTASGSTLSGRDNARLLGAWASATSRILYEDLKDPVVVTTNNANAQAPSTFRVGAWMDGTGADASFWQDGIEYAALWNVALEEARAREFNANPWQLVRPHRRRLYSIPASGAQTIQVGLNAETDSAFAVGKLKLKAIGLTAETDSVLAAAKTKALAVGLNTETDEVLASTRLKSRAVGLNTETDTALSLQAGQDIPVGLAEETDSAFSVSRLKARAVGLATTIDSALAVAKAKVKAVGLATETSTVLAATRVRTFLVGLVSSADSAFGVSRLKSLLVGLATETDTSLTLQGVTPPASSYVLKYPILATISRLLTQRARGRTHKPPWGSN